MGASSSSQNGATSVHARLDVNSSPVRKIKDWLKTQEAGDTTLDLFELRKEYSGVHHEYIFVQTGDRRYYRVDRRPSAKHTTSSSSAQDTIQRVSLLEWKTLEATSQCLLSFTWKPNLLPHHAQLDLKTVVALMLSITWSGEHSRYHLLQKNCFFYSQVLTCASLRWFVGVRLAVEKWEAALVPLTALETDEDWVSSPFHHSWDAMVKTEWERGWAAPNTSFGRESVRNRYRPENRGLKEMMDQVLLPWIRAGCSDHTIKNTIDAYWDCLSAVIRDRWGSATRQTLPFELAFIASVVSGHLQAHFQNEGFLTKFKRLESRLNTVCYQAFSLSVKKMLKPIHTTWTLDSSNRPFYTNAKCILPGILVAVQNCFVFQPDEGMLRASKGDASLEDLTYDSFLAWIGPERIKVVESIEQDWNRLCFDVWDERAHSRNEKKKEEEFNK